MKAEKVIEVLTKNGYAAQKRIVRKDGADREAVAVLVGTICPTIYPEFYEDGQEQELIKAVEQSIANAPEVNVEDLTDWNKAKENVRIALAPAGWGGAETVIEHFLDLEKYAYIQIGDIGRCIVTEQILKTLGVSREELFMAGLYNTEFQVKGILTQMKELVPDEIDVDLLPEPEPGEVPMFIMTTTEMNYGACAMLNNGMMLTLANLLESDLYILPSSIHEVIALPTNSGGEVEILREMVRDVNETQVPEGEILGYNVYHFSRETQELTIA